MPEFMFSTANCSQHCVSGCREQSSIDLLAGRDLNSSEVGAAYALGERCAKMGQALVVAAVEESIEDTLLALQAQAL